MFLYVCPSEHAHECFFQSACLKIHTFVGFISLSAYSKCCFYQYYCLCVKVRIHRGDRASGPSGQSQVIWGTIEISIWTPPPPPWKKLDPTGKCWTPSGSLEKYSFLCNNRVTIGSPPVHLGSNIENNYLIPYRCANLINTGDSIVE